MSRVGTITNVALLVLINLAVRQAAVAVFVHAADCLGIADCVVSFWGITCSIPRAQVFSWTPHIVLLAIGVSAFAFSFVFIYHYVIAPFTLFMLGLLVFCVTFDLIFQLPVRNFSGLFSSTFNLTGFIIFFSFIFMIAITTSNYRISWSYFFSAIQSYLAQDAAYLPYIAIQWAFPGMTSLYLMFVAFAFGSFTVHMMTVAVMLRQSALQR